jgi:hypothetical protein
MKKIIGFFVGLMLLCTSIVNAVSVTNSITYYDHQTVDSWYTDATNVLYVPQFNPAIGKPIAAKVYLKLNITNTFGFENRQIRSFSNPDFIGEINVTNSVNINFFGIEFLNLSATNTIDVAGYDGITDFGGTSGATATNIVNKTIVFDVAPEYISGYSVWEAVNKSSARSFARIYSGSFTYTVYTTAGADIWAVYTYVNEYNCPDCDKDCDKDKDDKDKDKDKDKEKNKKR